MSFTHRIIDRLRSTIGSERILRTFFTDHANTILLLLLVASIFSVVRVTYFPLTPTSDTTQYVQTAKYFAGEEGGVAHGNRILKPLAPLAMMLISSLVGEHYPYEIALGALSIIGYLALTPAIYFLLFLFLKNREESFVGSLLYLGAYPLLLYGLDLYTETFAWLFHLAGLYYATRYYFGPQTFRPLLLSTALTTVGFLWKEYTVLSGVALVTFVLMAHIPWRTKLTHLAASAALALPILIGWQAYVYFAHDYTYLQWLITGHGEPDATSQYSLLYMAKSMFALFLLGWLWVVPGMLKWHTFSREERIAGAVLAVTSCGFLAWGYVSSRLYFVLAPVLAILAARGLTCLDRRSMRYLAVFVTVGATWAWIIAVNVPTVRAWLVAL